MNRSFEIPRLFVCAGWPEVAEFNTNINSFFDPGLVPFPCPQGSMGQRDQFIGHVIMFDNIAVEGQCDYEPYRDIAVGLSREDARKWPSLRVHNYNLITSMKCATEVTDDDAPPGTRLCIGKEATVFVIAPVAPAKATDPYNAVPFLISSTCKEEKAPELLKILEMIDAGWSKHPFGEKKRGRIWTWADDGDGVYCAAKHALCTAEDLVNIDPIFEAMLKPHCPGLNLRVSKNGATDACNPKHMWK
jgi:hypothetical protein